MGRKSLPVSVNRDRPASLGISGLWPVWAALAVVVWTAFSPVLRNGFVDWDDRDWILENQGYRGLGWDQIVYAFTTLKGGVYQPLGWLLQGFTYAAFGLDPWGFHLLSLGFHVANVLLLHLLCVSLVARSMPGDARRPGRGLPWLCAIPVALYAVHPLRVEPVAWASCQAYLPSVTLSLLATLAYLRACQPDGPVRREWMIGSSLLIVLAVLTKGSAVVLPFVFLVLDAYPLGRIVQGRPWWPSLRGLVIEKAPILVFCLVFTGVAVVAKSVGIDPESTTQPVLVGRVAQAGYAAWFYLAKTIYPFGITAFYPRPEDENFLTPLFATCVVGAFLSVVMALRLRRRWPWLAAAMMGYLIIASPYLGLLRVGIPLAADRYSYAPSMAWVVLACAGICRLAVDRWTRPARIGAAGLAVAAVGGLMALGSAQCRVWDGDEHLWSQALANSPWSSHLHQLMGSTYAEAGEVDRAIVELRESVRIRPAHADALSDLGAALDQRGETDAAIECLREARRLRPDHAKVNLNLGGALVHQGQIDEAIAIYDEALRSRPEFPNLHFNRGVALLHRRRVNEAITALTRAVELRPGYAEAFATLGGALVLENRQDEAVAAYHQALRLDPAQSSARIGLGLALARLGRLGEAVAQLEQAATRDPRNPEVHHVLGAVLAAAHRPREAAAEFEEVLRLRPDHPQARLALAKARGHTM